MLRPTALTISVLTLLSGCGMGNHDPQPSVRAYEGPRVPPAGTVPRGPAPATLGRNGFPEGLFPDKKFLEQGRGLFNANCAVCHGHDGKGEGIAVKRGLGPVPSLDEGPVLTADPSSIHQVISEGKGRMPSYARRLLDRERWATAAYVKALQLSRRIELRRLTEDDKRRLNENSAP